jgi:hypothetical protein
MSENTVLRTVKKDKVGKRVDLSNPNWYKEFTVTDKVKETFTLNLVQPEHAEKEGIICDVVVLSAFGTFVFEGFYSNETDCVTVTPKYVNTYVDKNGDDQARSAVALNYDLHAHVLQTIDSVLE